MNADSGSPVVSSSGPASVAAAPVCGVIACNATSPAVHASRVAAMKFIMGSSASRLKAAPKEAPGSDIFVHPLRTEGLASGATRPLTLKRQNLAQQAQIVHSRAKPRL